MAFNASECAFEGFRLVRKRPAAFAAWCLFYLLFVIAAVAAVIATLAPMFMQLAHPAAVMGSGQGSGFGDVAQVAAFVRNNLPILLVGAAVMIPLVLIWAVMMMCAIFRAVLRPDEKGFGYLRLGGDEVRMIGLHLLIFVLGLAVWLVVGGVALAAVLAAKTGVAVPAGVWAFVGLLGLLAVLAYVFVVVRLSLCAPQTFAERRITLFGSWRLTRGHFWGLFGMYLLVIAIVIALQIVNAVVQLPFKAVQAHVVAFMIGVLNLVITAASRAAAYRELARPKADEAAKAVA
jgi:hypothetical protein